MPIVSTRYAKDQLFLAGVAFLTLSLMALFFLVASWLVGGDAFMASIYGKENMVALLAGAGLGALLMAVYREREPAAD